LSINAQVVYNFPTEESFEDGIADQEFVYTAEGWEIIGMGMPGTTTACPISQGVASSHYICSYNHNTTSVTRELKSMFFQFNGKDNAKLSFYYANPNWGGVCDELEISMRFNGNDTPTSVWKTTEAHNSWTYVEVSLPVNQNYVQLQFKSTSHYGYGVFLDRMRVEAWNNNEGDGTDATYTNSGTEVFSDLPASSIWNYTFNEMIYNYSYMPGSASSYDRINSISFYYMGTQTGGIHGYNRYVNIYMKNVSRNDFADEQFEPITEDDLVYSGYITAFAEGWMTIELDRPFYYKNYYGNNMMIAIDDNTGSHILGDLAYFKGSNTTNASIRTSSDTEDQNPFTATTGSIVNKLPNLKINYDYLQPATIPYYTDFEDDEFGLWYGPWMLKNTVGDGYAKWYFQGALGKSGYPTLRTTSFEISGHPGTVLAERLIQLNQADELKIQFNATVNGEGSASGCYDYLMVFLAPATENWETSRAISSSDVPYLGQYNSTEAPYALHFGDGLLNTRITNKNDETLSTIIPNPGKGQVYKLIFVWHNDSSGGTGSSAHVDDISITVASGDGIEENIESVLSVMPNPANDVIRVNGLNGTEEVNIYNTLGQVVMSARLSEGQDLNISDLSAGVYMLRSENSEQVVKFTVK
jgi:hypothetical protein